MDHRTIPDGTSVHHLQGSKNGILRLCLGLLYASGLTFVPAVAQTGGTYKVTNIVSDGSVPAITTDANFINPWAISASPTWWISAQGTGFSYVIPAAGTISF